MWETVARHNSTKKLKDTAMRLLAEGYKIEQIAAKLSDDTGESISVQWVKRILANDDAVELLKKHLAEHMMCGFAEAYGANLDLMRSTENEWLRHTAAREVMNQSKNVLFGAEESTMEIRIEGMPELGVPDNNELSITPQERAEAEKA